MLRKILFISLLCGSTAFSAPSNAKKTEELFSPHVWVRGDLLYWVPQASGLDANFGTGSVVQATSGGVATTTSTETDVDPSMRWDVGYRLALGGQFACNRWEIGALWTDFRGSGSQEINHGRWSAHLKQVDVLTLYNGYVSCVHLQPFIGLRGASILQKLFSEVLTEVQISGSGTALDTRTFRDREQFYGLGPLFGLNSSYPVGRGVSFYGNIGLALLYGNYHLRFEDHEVITAPATPAQIDSRIKKEMKAFDWNVDFALGIQWEYLIRNVSCLTAKLGLENHQYFDQSRLGHTFGNLSFSGGIFSLELAF